MKSKLGFHINVISYPGQVDQIIDCDARVIKVISSLGLLNNLHTALPKATYIARDWKIEDDFLRAVGGLSPTVGARKWLEAMRPSIVQAPFAYWESFNEMSAWDSMAAYGDFESERQRLMHEEGFKCCIGNFATGCPPDMKLWIDFLPALYAAHEYKNILGVHEYGGLWMDTWYGPNQTARMMAGNRIEFPPEWSREAWLFGRYRQVWKDYLEPNQLCDVRIVSTEFGLDMAATTVTTPLAGYTVGAWKTCTDAWRRINGRTDASIYYSEQLQWADRQMQKDPYILGSAIFTWGTFNDLWQNHEIRGDCANDVCRYIKSTKDSVVPHTLSVSGQFLRRNPIASSEQVAIVWPNDKLIVKDFYGNDWVKVEKLGGPSYTSGWAQRSLLELGELNA